MEKEPLSAPSIDKAKAIVQNPHLWRAEEVLSALGVDPKMGLQPSEALRRLSTYGRNELPRPPSVSFWAQVMRQFDDSLVRILLAVSCVSFFITLVDPRPQPCCAYAEPFVILLILAAGATAGVLGVARAEEDLGALSALQMYKAQVIRNGRLEIVDSAAVVPGDICVLHGGDRVSFTLFSRLHYRFPPTSVLSVLSLLR